MMEARFEALRSRLEAGFDSAPSDVGIQEIEDAAAKERSGGK